MITWHTHIAEKRWLDGEFTVVLFKWGNDRAMGYCDGTSEDEAELRGIAEEEGLDELVIERKMMQRDRERWTLGSAPEQEVDDGY